MIQYKNFRMNVSTNKGGLANRIKSIVSVIRMSNKNGSPYGVLWEVQDSYKKHNHILNCPFNKLFANEIEVKSVNNSWITYSSHCLMICDSDNLARGFNKFRSKCSIKFIKNDKLNRNIDFMYNKIPKALRDEYIEYFQELTLIDKLERKVNKFAEKFEEDTVSVHIRSWNRNGEKSRNAQLFNIERYEKVMSSEKYSGRTFYLASDSKDVVDYFTKVSELKDKVIVYPRETDLNTSRDFHEGVQEDLIELYLLSKNSSIIGSHFSTYTEVAWWVAKCPEDITVL